MFICVQRRAFLIVPLAMLARWQTEPWFGTWNLLLPTPGDDTPSPRYKRVATRIEPWEAGLKVTYDMVGIRGGVTHLEWTGKLDGKDYILQGMDTLVTHAYRRIDDRSYEIVIKDDGVVQATARVVVSPDGKTLEVSTEGKNADGQSVKSLAIYKRQ